MSTVICTTECYFTSTGFRVENGDYYSIIEFDKLFTKNHSVEYFQGAGTTEGSFWI